MDTEGKNEYVLGSVENNEWQILNDMGLMIPLCVNEYKICGYLDITLQLKELSACFLML